MATPEAPAESVAAETMACKHCGHPIELDVNFCPLCGAAVQGEALPDPLVGRVVADRYRIMQLIGRGGMGVVYKCEHTRMGKVMAIKLLHGEIARDQEVQRRFRREAQAASKLSHPSTVSIFDFGTADGLMYLVMEYVAGEDLGRILRGVGHIEPARAAALAAQACGSLAEAHDKGVVHRDLKPENLLVTRLRDGRELVKLLDFGLAKLREGEDRNEITSAGTLIGTPYYMAPEIIRGQNADHRVDIYALGAVIYRALTGVAPFTGSSPVAVLTRHLTDQVVPPSRRRPDLAIPRALDQIVLRCMAKLPEERFQRIDEVRDALLEYLASEGMSDSLLRESGLTRGTAAAVVRSYATGKHAVATRDDVERFERRLRRGRIAMWGLFASIAAGTAAGGVLFWREGVAARMRARDVEIEPNQSPALSTPIAPGTSVRGQIGVRLTPDRGDVDVYRLAPLRPGTWRLRATLSGQPNIDLVLELLRAGQSSAVAVADDGSEGAGEAIANFGVADAQYYLSVHEKLRSGERPRESISDYYVLRYEISPADPGVEVEPNDREEVASLLGSDATYSGYVESRGDVDYWCLDTQSGPLEITLTPPTGLDLELVLFPRDGTSQTTVDQTPSGVAERATLPYRAGARPSCVIVRASSLRPGEHGNPWNTYTLQVSTR